MWAFVLTSVSVVVLLCCVYMAKQRERFIPLTESEELVEVNYRDVGLHAVYPNVYFE